MKALVTGAGGFIGSYITDFLVEEGAEVCATVHKNKDNLRQSEKKIKITACDFSDKNDIENLVKKTEPDYVFHMAAQSFVIPSWQDPEKTYEINVIGTHHLLEALKESGAVVCIASSSAAYGLSHPEEIPIKETKEFRPSSPYAVSKAATDMLGFLYWRSYGMKILRLRFFNTIGPRKTGSAVADWAKGIAEIEAGTRKELGVGNLEPVVDFTDVRDSVKAIWTLTKKGRWGDAYNICSGKGHKMKEILEKMTSLSTAKIKVITDKAKFRPADDPIFIGDNTKLRSLGWKPEIPLEKTLQDTLDYWRNNIA
ncbi:MAG: GDP-mannose 4,6-dehydratase [Candidatus Aenigmarchaeota archaeon]|nr:GDP-mannose 4,6-dehydratase [Candidatus Aenigmarchaeota archaeon]